MKKVLLTIHFSDPTDKFWWDCNIKNKVYSYDPEKQTIHDLVKNICENEGMELSYKGKPQQNMFRDLKDGRYKAVGYIYRGKGEVHDRNMTKPRMVFWDVWVEVCGVVVEAEVEEIDQ